MPLTTSSTPTDPTRRSLTTKRRKTRRVRTIALSAVAAAALLGGTGFAVSSASGSTSAFGLPTANATSHPTVSDSTGGRVSVHAGSAVTRTTADTVAQMAISTGKTVQAAASGKADAKPLTTSLASLADYKSIDPDTVMKRVAAVQSAGYSVGTATTQADQRVANAKAVAARKVQAAAQARADAVRQAAVNTPDGAKATAKGLMASQYGWGDDQYSCLVSLWSKESGWNYKAYNAAGGATGIPQALPGSKMASVAADWSTNATTQIIWGLRYISGSYGTPCAAWSHSEANNWY